MGHPAAKVTESWRSEVGTVLANIGAMTMATVLENTMRSIKTGILILCATSFAVACGGENAGTQNPPVNPPPQQNKKPTVFAASPEFSADSLAVGESLRILGSDFILPLHGKALVMIRGTYFDNSGQQFSFDQTFEGNVKDTSTITWRMFPNIVFHPNGNRLGQFVGTVQVLNQGKDGSSLASQTYPITINIKPSLILKEARAEGCAAAINAGLRTTEEATMRFEVEAIGLRAPTPDAQMVFHWAFDAKRFQLDPEIVPIFVDNPLPETGTVTFQDRRTSGTTSRMAGGGVIDLFIPLQETFIQGHLDVLKTRKLPQSENGDNYTTTINVTAVDASGKSARLAIPIDVFKVASLAYDNTYVVAQRFEPAPVTGCIAGGKFPKNVDYREDNSESRSRDIGFNINAGVTANWGLPGRPFEWGMNFNVGFGVDVRGSVSSSKSEALDISGQVVPGTYAVFYRQTTKILRIGSLIAHNKCGEQANLGEAIVTDWVFAPDLAIGPSCMPRSNLPPAQKFR
jgi:hypothetical protein